MLAHLPSHSICQKVSVEVASCGNSKSYPTTAMGVGPGCSSLVSVDMPSDMLINLAISSFGIRIDGVSQMLCTVENKATH